MEESESSVGLFKITAALLLFCFAVVGGLLPQKLKNIGSKVVSCLNTAAGGVFLASAMVHMLPESCETLATTWGDAFPWGSLICMIGFLLILCTDQAVRICQDRGAKKSNGSHMLVPQEPPDAAHNHTGGECSDRHDGDGDDYTELSGVPHQTLLEKENGGQTCPNGNGVDRLGGEENDVDQHRNRGGRDVESTGGSVNHRPAPRNGFNCGYDVTSSVIYNRYSGGIPNPAAQNGSNSEGRRGHSHGLGSPGDGVLVRVALLLALSVHSILEGLGVGAKSTKAYNLLFAIGIHKGLAAYALGTSLLDSAIRFNEVVGFLIAFALMSPLGILIGAIIENDGEDAPGAACVALASGTFLYVSLMEVLPPELDSTTDGWSKMASLLAGFSLSAVMGWIVG
ncbi:unnamed protein product [Ascophyllum nodosum]